MESFDQYRKDGQTNKSIDSRKSKRNNSLVPGSLLGSMSDTECMLYKCIAENNHKSLDNYLKVNRKTNVIEITESRGYSLLAFSAFKHHTNCFKIIY